MSAAPAKGPHDELLSRLATDTERAVALKSIRLAEENGWERFRFWMDDPPVCHMAPNETPQLKDLIGDKPSGGWGFLSEWD